MALATLQKQGADAPNQGTNQRPCGNIGFGDKAGRRNGIDYKNVEPRNVIGNDHPATAGVINLRSSRWIDLDPHAATAYQEPGPLLHQTVAPPLVEHRKQQ